MNARKLAEIAVFRGAFQKMTELVPLVSLLKGRKLRTVLEIGTMKGGTLWLWCQLAEPDALILSIDLPDGPFGGGYTTEEMRRLLTYGRETQRMHLIRGDSHEPETKEDLLWRLDGRPVDLLFLDGDHRYGGVKQDFAMYSPLVKPGGLIVLHDILPHPQMQDCQVDRFWNEVKGGYRHRELVDPEDERGWGQWGGIGVLHYRPAP